MDDGAECGACSPDAKAVHRAKDTGRDRSKGKVFRVLTVLAYVLSVSLAAIMLSLYYVFLWEARAVDTPASAQHPQTAAPCHAPDEGSASLQLNRQTASTPETPEDDDATPLEGTDLFYILTGRT